jgi:hypothetical protein
MNIHKTTNQKKKKLKFKINKKKKSKTHPKTSKIILSVFRVEYFSESKQQIRN